MEDLPDEASSKCKDLHAYLKQRSAEVGDCVVWTGTVRKDNGYGQGQIKGVTINAHLLAYMAYHNMQLPRLNSNGKRLNVFHVKCTNPICIKNDHLASMTDKEYGELKKKQGLTNKGEKNSSCIITEEIANQIILAKVPKSHPMHKKSQVIADEFNTTIHVVNNILAGKSWKHLKRSEMDVENQTQTIENEEKEESSNDEEDEDGDNDNSNNTIKKRKTCYPKAHNNRKITEQQAKDIIASKKHKHDPEYKSQQRRADEFGVTIDTIGPIDQNLSWKYLDRPTLIVFPKPAFVWDEEKLAIAWERVQKQCVYNKTNNIHTNSPCLEWKGKLQKGRPYIKVFEKKQAAYIFACEYKMKSLKPEGLETRHSCDNRICCELGHLSFGTSLENAQDSIKHRSSKGFKTTDEQVQEIRRLYTETKLTQKEIAEEMGIGRGRVHSIVNYKSWKNSSHSNVDENEAHEDNSIIVEEEEL